MMRSKRLGKRRAGFSLIEVLVALFILALGVLGAAALQMNALKFNQTSSMRTQATFMAYQIVDRMRANREAALAGGYVLVMDAAKPTGTSVAQKDLAAWLTAITASKLPGGSGSVSQAGRVVTVTVKWNEARVRTDGGDFQTFVFETEL